MILIIFRETMTAKNMVVQKHPHKSAFLNREIHYKVSLHRGIHLQKSLPAEASPLLPIKLIIA